MANASSSTGDNGRSVLGEFSDRDLVLRLLGEKKSLLSKIHDERKLSLQWQTECLQLREENGRLHREKSRGKRELSEKPSESSSSSAKQEDLTYVEVRSLHKKIAVLESNIRELKKENGNLESQKRVLEAEVLRLANSLSRTDPELETELLKEQLKLFEEDFAKEKDEKNSAEGKVTNLNEQIHECQELISNLTIEVDMYKKAYQREKGEKESIIVHRGCDKSLSQLPFQYQQGLKQSFPRNRTLPKPQLQIVYPFEDHLQEEENEVRRRQQLQRAGVFSRNVPKSPTNCSPYYGGDAETDCLWHS